MRCLLVDFEGIDGSGKTTVSMKVVQRLSLLGYTAIYTHEPFSSPFSKALKDSLDKLGEIDPRIQALAMILDRYYHVDRYIRTLCKICDVIALDRYIYSSLAYQGALGAPIEWMERICEFLPKPNLVIYLDVSVDTAIARIQKGSRQWSLYERRSLLEQIRRMYEQVLQHIDTPVIYIDAEKPIDEVVEECFSKVLQYLRLHADKSISSASPELRV